MKKYDNESPFFSKWTTKKLKRELVGYHEMIYIIGCYGSRDLANYYRISTELDKRGVMVNTQVVFA